MSSIYNSLEYKISQCKKTPDEQRLVKDNNKLLFILRHHLQLKWMIYIFFFFFETTTHTDTTLWLHLPQHVLMMIIPSIRDAVFSDLGCIRLFMWSVCGMAVSSITQGWDCDENDLYFIPLNQGPKTGMSFWNEN